MNPLIQYNQNYMIFLERTEQVRDGHLGIIFKMYNTCHNEIQNASE